MSRNSSAVSGPIPAILVLTDSSRQCPSYNRPIFQNFRFWTVQFRKFHCQKQILRRMHFFKIFFSEEDFLGNRDSEMKKKQYFNEKSQLFKDVDFAWIKTWKDGCLCWYDVILLHRLPWLIKNFVNQSLNLASVPLPKVLRFIYSRKKGHQACKQVRGYVSLLKTVVTLKESRALPFPSSREIRHSCNGQTRE